MTSISPFLSQHAFDPEITKLMGEAYDAAFGEFGDREPPALLKEIIAKRIIEAAEKGERDPERLRDSALDSLGLRGRVSRSSAPN